MKHSTCSRPLAQGLAARAVKEQPQSRNPLPLWSFRSGATILDPPYTPFSRPRTDNPAIRSVPVAHRSGSCASHMHNREAMLTYTSTTLC